MLGSHEEAPKKRRIRWGLLLLGFLLLGTVALFTAQAQGYHTLGTIGCTVIAFVGAAFCSFKGWRAMENLEWKKRR